MDKNERFITLRAADGTTKTLPIKFSFPLIPVVVKANPTPQHKMILPAQLPNVNYKFSVIKPDI